MRRVALARQVVVNLTTGTALRGVLWDQVGDVIVLRRAVLMGSGAAEPVPMDGEALIQLSRVDFIQAVD